MSQVIPSPVSCASKEVIAEVEKQIREDLTHPRFLIEQVVSEISARHEYPIDRLGEFFNDKYAKLEDYEVDLVFSPLFTPNWEDQLRYAKLLGPAHLSVQDLKALVAKLENESLNATFQTQAAEVWRVPLHPVNLDRYVNRLMIDKPLSDFLQTSIEAHVPKDDQHAIYLLAKNPVWEGKPREVLLDQYLQAFSKNKSYTLDKVRFLTDFVRTYRPGTQADLLRQLKSLAKSCEADLNNVADQSFYDQQFKELYSDSERAHFKNLDVQNHYNYMMEMAEALLKEESTIETSV
ncbi:MAG: hypothetical protein VKJ04_03450 [Vampirovibrionales bacterium]|nr:hypothetical protein [Vampirovibrionales bacterium]